MFSGCFLIVIASLLRGFEYFFQETDNLFPGIMFWRMFPSQMPYQLSDLTPVKPQSMFITAYVDEDFRLFAYRCFFHLMATDGAISFLFWRSGLLRVEDAVKEHLCLFKTLRLKQKLELSRIKPHTLAAITIIELNIMILNDYHSVFTNRAYHCFQTSSGDYNSVDAQGSHVKIVA